LQNLLAAIKVNYWYSAHSASKLQLHKNEKRSIANDSKEIIALPFNSSFD